MTELSAHALTVWRGERLLFEDLSFELAPGSVLYIKGANGSGKTTLLRTLASLHYPDAGDIQLDGQSAIENTLPLRQITAFLSHKDALKNELTARENLDWLLKLAESPSATATDTLRACGLESIADLPCGSLSAGQRRRVALARVQASGAALWLLDEPTEHLDSAAVDWLRNSIDQHIEKGGMAIIATHRSLALQSNEVTLRLGA